ncbi:MAG: endonuclease domain-containing protein [Nocardioides sp.]|nr:endonuclease domain-containing protein [Nocardioides sp.]
MIPEPIHAQAVIKQLGSVAKAHELLSHLTSHQLRTAVEKGHLVRLAHGRYGLPGSLDAKRAAASLTGSASHLSAALLHGWQVARPPEKPWVTVPRNRKVRSATRERINIVYGSCTGPVTSPLQTVVDCARRLSFGEALSVADSALRHGDITWDELREAAVAVRGQGAVQCRRVAGEANSLAANPFESMTRALALGVGLDVRPQVKIEVAHIDLHPDLVDVRRRLVIECDGYLHHANDPRTFHSDLWRYTSLTVLGWTVLRFAYHHILSGGTWARSCLETYV